MASSWLTLQEYSTQLGISISTLRRKIKTGEIEYIFKNGRYFLKASVEKESFSSKEELKTHYQKLLMERENSIQKLKEDREDLLHLVDFLEKEKEMLIEHLKDQDSISP